MSDSNKGITLKGKVILIGETESFASGFIKRELVIETTEEQYPQKLKMEFVKDKCGILDHYKIDDKVEVGVNIRGNEYQGKYYVSLQGWKITNLSRANGIASTTATNTATTSSSETISAKVDDDSDLPF